MKNNIIAIIIITILIIIIAVLIYIIIKNKRTKLPNKEYNIRSESCEESKIIRSVLSEKAENLNYDNLPWDDDVICKNTKFTPKVFLY
jgi:hypothetical protein